jgi:hypothetical protein
MDHAASVIYAPARSAARLDGPPQEFLEQVITPYGESAKEAQLATAGMKLLG